MNFGWFRAEIAYLSGCSDWPELDFVECERTLSELMRLFDST